MRCEDCKHYSMELDLHERTGLPVSAKHTCSLKLNPNVPISCHLYETQIPNSKWYQYTGTRWKRMKPERNGYEPMRVEPDKSWNKDMPWYKRGKR